MKKFLNIRLITHLITTSIIHLIFKGFENAHKTLIILKTCYNRKGEKGV